MQACPADTGLGRARLSRGCHRNGHLARDRKRSKSAEIDRKRSGDSHAASAEERRESRVRPRMTALIHGTRGICFAASECWSFGRSHGCCLHAALHCPSRLFSYESSRDNNVSLPLLYLHLCAIVLNRGSLNFRTFPGLVTVRRHALWSTRERTSTRTDRRKQKHLARHWRVPTCFPYLKPQHHRQPFHAFNFEYKCSHRSNPSIEILNISLFLSCINILT